jgi:hypothetical protein
MYRFVALQIEDEAWNTAVVTNLLIAIPTRSAYLFDLRVSIPVVGGRLKDSFGNWYSNPLNKGCLAPLLSR